MKARALYRERNEMISNLSALILFVFMLSHGSPALSYDFSTPATDIATASGNPGQSIYEKYKDAIVDVDVRIEMTDGKVRHRGGSGFFVDREGHILTDAHVVKFKNKPQITLAELGNIKKITYFVILNSKNRKYRAKLVGANDYADIALLKVINIDPKDYAVVRFGDPDRLRVGDKIWAIGNQRSFANSLTGGGVSYLHRHIDLSYIEDFIQTDCPINPGNSGCPVFNEREEVVGITQAIMTQSDGPAFATSINLARIDLLKRGELELPSLGFEAMIDNFPRDGSSPGVHGFEDLQTLKMKTEIEEIENLVALARETYFNNWAIVISVDEFEDPDAEEKQPGTAKKAGLIKGDLIISLDGKPVRNGMDVRVFLMDKSVGDVVVVAYKRAENGFMVLKSVDVTLTKRVLMSGDDAK